MSRPQSFEDFRRKHNQCPSCEVLMINGRRCHEIGCPERMAERRREMDADLEDLNEDEAQVFHELASVLGIEDLTPRSADKGTGKDKTT